MTLKSISRNEFINSDKAIALRKELDDMTKSPLYNTKVVAMFEVDESYFAEKHMKYMSNHLAMDHFQYVQNLRLMTKFSR